MGAPTGARVERQVRDRVTSLEDVPAALRTLTLLKEGNTDDMMQTGEGTEVTLQSTLLLM